MTANPHAEKAKELLAHYFGQSLSPLTFDRQETDSIVDEIIAAVHLEIERELKAVFDGIGEGRKAAAEMKEKPKP